MYYYLGLYIQGYCYHEEHIRYFVVYHLYVHKKLDRNLKNSKVSLDFESFKFNTSSADKHTVECCFGKLGEYWEEIVEEMQSAMLNTP